MTGGDTAAGAAGAAGGTVTTFRGSLTTGDLPCYNQELMIITATAVSGMKMAAAIKLTCFHDRPFRTGLSSW